MEVDLSKLEAGHTVKFRCGGEAVVKTYESNHSGGGFLLSFEPLDDWTTWYSRDGRYQTGLSPFDIIEIIPKPFDWKDVKPGDAFIDEDGLIIYYLNDYCQGKRIAAWSCTHYRNKEELTRSPENDKGLEHT